MSVPEVPSFHHATAVLIGERGILIRGPSGSGKSSLAAALLEVAAARGDHAALVGDDRVALETHGGRLIAFPHPAIAGLIEQRGRGIVAVDHAPAAVIRLVVDLVPASAPLPVRLPDTPPRFALLGVSVAWLVLPAAEGCAAQALRVLALLRSWPSSG